GGGRTAKRGSAWRRRSPPLYNSRSLHWAVIIINRGVNDAAKGFPGAVPGRAAGGGDAVDDGGDVGSVHRSAEHEEWRLAVVQRRHSGVALFAAGSDHR